MVYRPTILILAAAALVLSPGPTLAARHVHRSAGGGGDAQFVRDAGQGGLAEVALGRLSQQNGVAAAVRDFGQRMIDDHSKANSRLKQIATADGFTVPDSPSATQDEMQKHLAKLSGADFDRAYMRAMVAGHEQVLAAFRRASSSLSDPKLRDFAAQTVPTIEEHLRMAREAAAKVGAR